MSASAKLEYFAKQAFAKFPWQIVIQDWLGHTFEVGQNQAHWYRQPLVVTLHTPRAANYLLDLNSFALVESYLQGELDLEGNFYLLTSIKEYVPFGLKPWQFLKTFLVNRHFQTTKRTQVNVKSHYDIPQDLLDIYLDKKYLAYSCAMFDNTELSLDGLETLLQPGKGLEDTVDSLEKAQYRKFKDAVDFIAPAPGETLLDVGCGYGGQLLVALQSQPFGKVVGWTHSSNQTKLGRQWLRHYDAARWELNEGDYREDQRRYHHVCSTGMICHVGPKGLLPYVKHVRKHIHPGGRYVHHCLMATYSAKPLEMKVGIAFNKKYVWPGFHWYTLGEHVTTLERNGFKVLKIVNLKQHYTKTLTAWYERMMVHKDYMVERMGEPTFRAWRLYLGGGAGLHSGDINRIYCIAD